MNSINTYGISNNSIEISLENRQVKNVPLILWSQHDTDTKSDNFSN